MAPEKPPSVVPSPDAIVLWTTLRPVLWALGFFELIALTGLAPAPHLAFDVHRASLFMSGAFAAAFIVYAASRPRAVELGVTIAVAALLALRDPTRKLPILLG